MKQVRFDTPTKSDPRLRSGAQDCQDPRPYIDSKFALKRHLMNENFLDSTDRSAHNDFNLVQQLEISNSCPYPVYERTSTATDHVFVQSSELELSLLDGSCCDIVTPHNAVHVANTSNRKLIESPKNQTNVLTAIENHLSGKHKNQYFASEQTEIQNMPKQLHSKKYDNFFITPDQPVNTFKLPNWMSESKENPLKAKMELQRKSMLEKSLELPSKVLPETLPPNVLQRHCYQNESMPINRGFVEEYNDTQNNLRGTNFPSKSYCIPQYDHYLPHNMYHFCPDANNLARSKCCHQHCCYDKENKETNSCPPDKRTLTAEEKTLAIEKYEHSKKKPMESAELECTDKRKREPTVKDLFKIIKLQNEQLKILQEKVDSILSLQSQSCQTQFNPAICSKNQDDSLSREHDKISIGVMTSLEMIHTSAILNEIVRKEHSLQCNVSQISVKEVITRQHSKNKQSQPVPLHQPPQMSPINNENLSCNNFLEGIQPVDRTPSLYQLDDNYSKMTQETTGFDEKTLNEQSLYNLKIDNATTPQMSPEKSMCLDVRDYSDSESDESNVGWTYYNKVMTRVNGLLQDSDMPPSAAGMYRRTGRCTRLHVDVTDVSVTTCKRVNFSGLPAVEKAPVHAPPAALQDHLRPPLTDTSLKMRELAAKYLTTDTYRPLERPIQVSPANQDVSFATQNYMRQHRILPGAPPQSRQPVDMPTRFLDITALKQQPKLL